MKKLIALLISVIVLTSCLSQREKDVASLKQKIFKNCYQHRVNIRLEKASAIYDIDTLNVDTIKNTIKFLETEMQILEKEIELRQIELDLIGNDSKKAAERWAGDIWDVARLLINLKTTYEEQYKNLNTGKYYLEKMLNGAYKVKYTYYNIILKYTSDCSIYVDSDCNYITYCVKLDDIIYTAKNLCCERTKKPKTSEELEKERQEERVAYKKQLNLSR